MLVGVLVALGVLGAIALLVVLFLQRGRDGMDLSLGGLLRVYLYLASLAGVIALLPMGIYQALAFAIVPQDQFSFRPGAGEALSGGLAALPLWLAYLWLVQRALRGDSRMYAAGPGGGPPPQPAPVGARIGPGPS